MTDFWLSLLEVRIGFTQDAYDVTEDAGFAIVIVEILNGTLASEREVIITLQTRDGTAVSDREWWLSNAFLDKMERVNWSDFLPAEPARSVHSAGTKIPLRS